MGTVVIGAIVFGLLFLAGRKLYKDRKKGESCGCGGCTGCSGGCGCDPAHHHGKSA